MIVAKLTGWGLADLLDQTVEELLEWHKAARKVQQEIASKTSKR